MIPPPGMYHRRTTARSLVPVCLRALFLPCQQAYAGPMRWIALVLLCAACAPRMRFPGPVSAVGKERHERHERHGAPAAARDHTARGNEAGQRVARAAASFVGKNHLVVNGKRYRWDCSGFV